jgi:2-dehydropantoate 2-reductase
MNIIIAGVGGVGGYFGGKLAFFGRAQANRHYITFLARGAHRDAIKRGGLVLKTAEEGELLCVPDLVTDDPANAPDPDPFLLCVKCYYLTDLVRQLASRFKENTVLLPLLNGVDVHARIRHVTEAGTILPACVYVGTHIESPGIVVQSGGACTILFGPHSADRSDDPTEITSLFKDSGIRHQWLEDPYPAIWSKFIFIAAFGLVTAAFDVTLGEVMASAELGRSVRTIMAEVHQLSQEAGIGLNPDIVPESFEKGRGFPPETKTSFQGDVEAPGKRDERDLFGGNVLRLGTEFGVAVPESERIYRIIDEREPA